MAWTGGGWNKGRRMAAEQRDGSVSRRDFLRAGSLSMVGWSLAEQAALAGWRPVHLARKCIFVLMTGGASQLETFDPKPEAPAEIRGPFRAISTSVPGLALSETLPLLAQRADRFAVLRTLSHDAAPLHETGWQLLQTGQLATRGQAFPHWSSVVARYGGRSAAPHASVILPGPLRPEGTQGDRGQTAGLLGTEFEPQFLPIAPEPDREALRKHYGDSRFGRLLLQAREAIELGHRCVTVNLFDSLMDDITWDCHGGDQIGRGTIFDGRDVLCPQFDRAMSGLLDDLAERDLLQDTLVVATGEFGRTPRINDRKGRDHWPHCWSALLAGGGVTGGAVWGTSDATASQPLDRPVAPAELTATLLHWFGIAGDQLPYGPGETPAALLAQPPLTALWT